MDYVRYYLSNLFMLAGIAGFVIGGTAVWLGFATFPAVVVLDLLALDDDLSVRAVRHPRLADVPLYVHALLVPALVAAAAYRIHAGEGGGPLGVGACAGVVLTLGWLGVMPNIPVAHELMHRRERLPRFVAFLCTATIADPLRRLAHLRGHHAKLGLASDSDTARRGETIYGFLLRAAIGGTREAFESERDRLASRGASVWSWRSDVVRSAVLTAGALGLVGGLAGGRALLVVALGFGLSRLLLEAFNYLQHYGLVRAPGTRFQRRHSWSHLTPVVRAAAFEITNHAHHHMDPSVRFHALVPDAEAPRMPSALVCLLAALIPPVWERWIAIPRLRHWDEHFATPEEHVLAAEANRAARWPVWQRLAPQGDAARDREELS
jgi:xylene monooxygenase subunit XylM